MDLVGIGKGIVVGGVWGERKRNRGTGGGVREGEERQKTSSSEEWDRGKRRLETSLPWPEGRDWEWAELAS